MLIYRSRQDTAQYAGVAQLVEQLICNQQVGGSSPSTSFQLNMGEFQSGQMGQTVNLLSTTSVVRIHPLPFQKIPLQSARGFFKIWGYSSAGRVLDWQSRGHGFDPRYLHHI